MTFKMYTYTGLKNVINKSITYVGEVTGVFKNDTDLIEPTLVLTPGYEVTNKNYFIIDGLNYFVKEVTRSQERLVVQLDLDDLESYKSSILANYAVLDRSTNKFNAYQVDHDIPMINSNEITVTKFPNGFSGESLILTVSGG